MSPIDIPNASGVYRIVCLANKKFYIGSAINLRIRWYGHRNALKRKLHRNQKLQRAWDKYGESMFCFEIVELVLPLSLLEREQYWLDTLEPWGKNGFNIAHTAHAPNLGVKASLETKAKLSASMKGKNKGKSKESPSASTRTKMSAARRAYWANRTDRTTKQETRMKRSRALMDCKQSAETCAKKSAVMTGKTYKKRRKPLS